MVLDVKPPTGDGSTLDDTPTPVLSGARRSSSIEVSTFQTSGDGLAVSRLGDAGGSG